MSRPSRLEAFAMLTQEPRPPEDVFHERYNARAEFPVATLLSVLIHVAAGVFIVFVLFRLMDPGQDRSAVSVRMIDVNSGDDDSGDGKLGSGGSESPLFAQENRQPTQAAIDALASPNMLPEIKESVRQDISVVDPTEKLPITDANAASLAMTKKSLRDKLLGLGSKPGTGDTPGSGNVGPAGDGNGTGANSARARSLRWTLRFSTSSGRNYLDQVAALGAVIAIPLPPSEEKLLVFEDLNNPSKRHVADDAEIARLAEWMKFSDVRRESTRQVGEALILDFTPRSFWAFFPKKLEDELAGKEKGYRNRRPENIDETVFQVTIRNGTYDILVVEQTAKP